MSRPTSPIFAKPIPKRSPSQELDLNGSAKHAKENGAANGTDIINRLEATADEM